MIRIVKHDAQGGLDIVIHPHSVRILMLVIRPGSKTLIVVPSLNEKKISGISEGVAQRRNDPIFEGEMSETLDTSVHKGR